jgi:PKD repeat protein
MSLASWQALGYDQHSIIATPSELFTNSASNDYSLKPGSPAIDIGLALAGDVPDDIRDVARPQRNGYDIGCYEAVSPTAVPLVDFAANPRAGAVPLVVQFADLSAGDLASWLWDFGDGQTSTLRDPLHTYSGVGTFTVKLIAANVDGQASRTRSAYITVTAAPDADYFCTSATVEIGKWLKGDQHSVRASDDSYLKVKAGKQEGQFSSLVTYVFEAGLTSLSSLTVTSESRSSGSHVRQQVLLFNPSTTQWDVIDDRSVMGTADTTTICGVADPRRYLSPSGEVRARIRTTAVTGGKWKHFVDLVKITATP